MKKVFTLLTFILLACAVSLQAQTRKWWGYMGDATNAKSIGIGQPDVYHCAMFLPGNTDVAAGKKICGIRFAMLAENVTDVKVWIASELPTTDPDATNTLWLADVATADLSGSTEVTLPTPFDVPDEGVFVGYSFTITATQTTYDQYPVVSLGDDHPDGFWLRTNNTMPEWYNQYGENFGVAGILLLLEGTFGEYLVAPYIPLEQYMVQTGQTVDVDVIFANFGEAPVSSISYTLGNEGEAGEEHELTFNNPITTYQQSRVTITIPADETEGSVVKALTVTKVNGSNNQSVNATTRFTLNTKDRVLRRNVVVEEFTGTGCGWCPRGIVGMQKLRNTFGDRFIGIAIHQYNDADAMYNANYPYLNFGGAPSCRINRGEVIDPYYGENGDICDDFRAALNEPATLGVDVSGIMDEDLIEVQATARIEPMFDMEGCTLELALVADGLSGTTSGWWQSNYYSGQSASQVEEDLRIFCPGGKYSSSSIKGMTFNDVVIGTSYVRGENQLAPLGTLTAGQVREVSFTLDMPTKATLRTALKKSSTKVYVVAIVVDNSGRIVNAAMQAVTDLAGVHGIEADDQGTTASYTLGGMRLTAPQRGISIVRKADGTVRKVVK